MFEEHDIGQHTTRSSIIIGEVTQWDSYKTKRGHQNVFGILFHKQIYCEGVHLLTSKLEVQSATVLFSGAYRSEL
jgi:hypothetical protein